MTRSLAGKYGEASRLYALLDEIDRAGLIAGTASRLDWLRLKAAAGQSRTRINAPVLYALLTEIHRIGLIAGTETYARWQLLKAGMKRLAVAAPVRRMARCHATFLFWRGRQARQADTRAARRR